MPACCAVNPRNPATGTAVGEVADAAAMCRSGGRNIGTVGIRESRQ